MKWPYIIIIKKKRAGKKQATETEETYWNIPFQSFTVSSGLEFVILSFSKEFATAFSARFFFFLWDLGATERVSKL